MNLVFSYYFTVCTCTVLHVKDEGAGESEDDCKSKAEPKNEVEGDCEGDGEGDDKVKVKFSATKDFHGFRRLGPLNQ